jgi:hypothetical protein
LKELALKSIQVSASETLMTMVIESRRRFMSRTAESVLKTFTWMLGRNTLSAELVRLPSS